MTILSTIPSPSTMARLQRTLIVALARFKRLVNGWVTAALVYHEREAARFALRHHDDGELVDIGFYRSPIDGVIARTAQSRLWRFQNHH